MKTAKRELVGLKIHSQCCCSVANWPSLIASCALCLYLLCNRTWVHRHHSNTQSKQLQQTLKIKCEKKFQQEDTHRATEYREHVMDVMTVTTDWRCVWRTGVRLWSSTSWPITSVAVTRTCSAPSVYQNVLY